jgi:indolepyruvate ferredoxin oxidoreductase
MTKTAVRLDDKYLEERGRIFLSSTQALVRLPLEQRRRDAAAGLNTAGFVTGYRGSPIGVYDSALWAAREQLDRHHVHFRPAVNEELAASSIRGTQQLHWFKGAKYDGVFALWYGKHLGVDRACEALKLGNLEGSAKNGGVLVVAADDHGGKSSASAAQSEHTLIAALMPILYPANTQEYLDYGIYGIALSRFSGLWTAFKAVNDTIELTASVSVDSQRAPIVLPQDAVLPPEGLNIIARDYLPLAQERRVIDFKLPAAQAFVRANELDKVALDAERRTLGIVSAGKVYLDVRQALLELGIDDQQAARLGIRLYKPAMIWPLEPQRLRDFIRGHSEIFVIEEKRPVIEEQLKSQLYNVPASERPRIVGKTDEAGATLLSAHGELSPDVVARAIAKRLQALHLTDSKIDARAAHLEAAPGSTQQRPANGVVRTAYFCSGCPHNISTRVPEGSLAFNGVGCYALASLFMPDRPTEWAVQMGGEGSLWVGLSPFTETSHTFQNLGDGTYFHSGILAVRAAVASGANITYKLLYNDAVAMTGGQPVDGKLTPWSLANQLYYEGVDPIVVVADDPHKYPAGVTWPPGTTIRHRDELDAVQRELRTRSGANAIIYDQVCAAEKRRRRKRRTFPDPATRVFINQDVCEGCGDCSTKSNCVSVLPLETEFGRKRRVDQSNCNKDYSCVKGFCPAFVTVHGGALRKAGSARSGSEPESLFADLPEPPPAPMGETYNILLTGIGGTGVLTVGAILGMAAHLEGKGCSVMDITGMAQKGGSVLSHIRLARAPEHIFTARLWPESCDVLLGCDLVVSSGQEALRTIRPGRGHAVLNTDVHPTAQFQANQKIQFKAEDLLRTIESVTGTDRLHVVAGTSLATRLMGDSVATNLFMLGFAMQIGSIPLSLESIREAIRLNGVAVKANLLTLDWGRLAAHDLEKTRTLAGAIAEPRGSDRLSSSLDELIARREQLLTDYQDAAYARRYRELVEEVRQVERNRIGPSTQLTEAVARNLARLMAYKDEYEVARLYTNGDFERRVREQFDGSFELRFHLAPPLLARRDPVTGEPRKLTFGPRMLTVFRLLARFKWLRGTKLDIFGYTAERRRERLLVDEYISLVREILAELSPANHTTALTLASMPEEIRGFGHVKDLSIAAYEKHRERLLGEFKQACAREVNVA